MNSEDISEDKDDKLPAIPETIIPKSIDFTRK